MTNRTKAFIILYAIGAIITFGHAWNRDYSDTFDKQATAIMAAPACAAVWPLYWSAFFWKGEPK